MAAEQQYAWQVAESTADKTPTTAAGTTAGLLLTPARLRVWGLRSAMSLLDQGLTAGAGFGVNLLLARWMAPEVYGAFAVAFAGSLFISGFHNVLLLEPLSVFGPSRHAERLPAYFRAQIGVHGLLTATLSVLAVLGGLVLWGIAPGSPLVGALLGAGLALPFLLFAWLARRMCYVVQRPSMAVLGSGFYLAFVVAGLFALGHYGWLGSFTAFLLMGCGSALAASLLLCRLGMLRGSGAESGVSWRVALRENWTYGRWLVGSAVLYPVSSQAQMFLAAAMLGLGSAGILRAMQLPSLVMAQLIMITGPLFLPALSRDFGRGAVQRLRHKAKLVSLGLAGAALCFTAVLAFGAGSIEYLLFGGKYSAYAWLMPVLALIPMLSGLYQGFAMALRASQKPHFDLLANSIAAPLALLSSIVLIRWRGLDGAALAMVVSPAVSTVVTLCYFRRLGPGLGRITGEGSSKDSQTGAKTLCDPEGGLP